MGAAGQTDEPQSPLPPGLLWFERLFRNRWRVLTGIAVFAVLTRASVFGDPNYHIDESFYFLIGQRLQAGDQLYIDIWDRKPPGLYLVYALLANISHQFWIVHLAAGLSAAGTAFVIYRLAQRVANRQGAVLAALCYLALLPKFGGAGGQSPVFYNLLIATAALLIAPRSPDPNQAARSLHVEAIAVLCCGIALTLKPTVLFEATFFGSWLLWSWHRQGMLLGPLAKRAGILALVAALPTLGYFAWYAAEGHFAILWQSVVSSNLNRQYNPENLKTYRIAFLAGQLGLPLGTALLATVLPARRFLVDAAFRFVLLWALVALTAVLVFPNVFDHYVLPTLAPLSIVAAPFYGRRDFGLPTAIVMIAAFLVAGNCLHFSAAQTSRREMEAIVQLIDADGPGGGLLVYGAPVSLYTMTATRPPVPLSFPPHLFDRSERDVSPYKTLEQARLALAAQPAAVIVQDPLLVYDANVDVNRLVAGYIRECRSRKRMPLQDMYLRFVVDVYTGCGPHNAASGPGSTRS
ncbi:MAG: hypothetical protein ACKOQM_10245 [Novosphingobium sp.]